MPSIAPLVAGHWPRRLGGLPGPFSAPAGSGESPNGANLQVELFVDGTWVDITSFTMTRDGSQQIGITKGQPNEGSNTEPSRCTLQLNNRDGRFSPRNARGQWYGKIGKNQPLRVSVPSGNDKSYRFWGEVTAWPQSWDITGTDVWVDVDAAGILRRLGQGTAPEGSALYISFSNANPLSGVFFDPAVAYWPLEDASGATRIASGLAGGSAMTISGTPSLAAYTGFVGSNAIPTMGTASFAGTIASYVAAVTTRITFLLALPAGGGTNGQVLTAFTASGALTRWECYYSTASSGSIGLNVFTQTGSVALNVVTGGGFNGTPTAVTIELIQVGPDLDVTLWTTNPTTGSGAGYSGTILATTAGVFTAAYVAPQGGLADTAVGHLCIQTSSSSDSGVSLDFVRALHGYASEPGDDRIIRLLRTFGVTSHLYGTFELAPTMGAQLNSTLMQLILDAVNVDAGLLYELIGELGIGYRQRQTLENQTTALTLDYAAFNLAEVPTPLDDDQYTRNDITVSRTGGSSSRAVQTNGTLSVLPAPAGVGRYDTATTLNVEADSSLDQQAGWRLHMGTVDEARYPRISVNLAHPSFTSNPALRNQVLAVRPGDRITIVNPPAWLPPEPISQIVLGQSETVDNFQHRVTFNCAPESPYHVMVLDDTMYGRLDGDSTLDQPAAASDTVLSVATASGPGLSTSLADSPFDLMVSGERVTVAAVGQQLATNPFISGVSGWTAQNSAIASSTAFVNTSAGAAASLQITPDGVSASGGAIGAATAVGSITPGQTYTVCMWAYSPGGWSDLRPCVDWYDSGAVFLSSGLGVATVVPAGQWTFIQQTLTAPASASIATPRARHGGTPPASAVWYAWGIRLVPTASATASSPQQVTVVRAVNGISKALPAGSAVSLYQPVVLAL